MSDPELVRKAVTAFVKSLVKQWNDAGETTPEIAKKLGFKSHASVVQYLTPGHPVKVTDAVQRRVAEIAFESSRDLLDAEALRWFSENQVELPAEYDAALTFLKRLHDRNFIEAANEHFRTASHNARPLTINELADQIYELAQQMKGKAEFERKPSRTLTDDDASAPGMGGKKRVRK